MTAAATQYGAAIAGALQWAETLLDLHDKWTFAGRVAFEARSKSMLDLEYFANELERSLNQAFWSHAAKMLRQPNGAMPKGIGSAAGVVELVNAARAYVAEYRQ